MKRIISFLGLSLLFSMMIFGASKNNKSVSVIGYVKSYGNVPFNYPCIESLDGRIYTLAYEDKSELFNTQGQMIQVDGELIKKSKRNEIGFMESKDGTINVAAFKIMKDNVNEN